MGVIGDILALLFGGGRNVVRETASVFVENPEARAVRDMDARDGALRQFAAEFAGASIRRRGLFDRAVDGLNRLPRPALALGTLALFASAMIDPLWFAARMQGIALVPEPLWWLLGVIVSFYFGARHQAKAQELQRDLAATMARAPVAVRNLEALERMRADDMGAAGAPADPNPALDAWRASRAGGADAAK